MSKGAAGLIIFLVVLAGILAGVWLAVNGGFTGTVQGTVDKLYAMMEKTPADEGMGLTPPPYPMSPPKPEETGEEGEQTEEGKKKPGLIGPLPFLGAPGLGIPAPTPEASKPTPDETAQTPTPEAEKPAVPAPGAAEQIAGGLFAGTSVLKTPTDVLKACVETLRRNDLVGCEKYVSQNGMTFKQGSTIGVHEVLWKGLFVVQAYQSIGYNSAIVSGQTALIPLYAELGQSRTVVAYVVMAHRGDGWKLDHITDPSRF